MKSIFLVSNQFFGVIKFFGPRPILDAPLVHHTVSKHPRHYFSHSLIIRTFLEFLFSSFLVRGFRTFLQLAFTALWVSYRRHRKELGKEKRGWVAARFGTWGLAPCRYDWAVARMRA